MSHIAHDRDLAMIGSQAIHAITDDVLDEVLIFHDRDVQFDPDDPLVAVIRKQRSRAGRGRQLTSPPARRPHVNFTRRPGGRARRMSPTLPRFLGPRAHARSTLHHGAARRR
jgi:hypothetical protein